MSHPWFQAARGFLALATRPLRHSEEVWGWLDLAVRIGIFLGAVGAGGAAFVVRPDGTPTWFAIIAYVAVVAAVLFLVAGTRMQKQQLDESIDPRRIPHNRDALIAAITDLEARAKEVVTNGWALRASRELKDNPRMSKTVDLAEDNLRESKRTYNTARDAFKREERIAGPAFTICLASFRNDVQFAALTTRPLEEIAAVHQEIARATEKVLGHINSGGAYRPMPSIQNTEEPQPQ